MTDDLSVRRILAVLRHRWPLIAVIAVAAGVAAFVYSTTKPDEYEATASLLFRDRALDQRLSGTAFVSPTTDPDRTAVTNLRLLKVNTIAERTAAALGQGSSRGEVAKSINVQSAGQSDLVQITATTEDPELSARMANTYAQQFIAFRVASDRNVIVQTQRLIQRRYDDLSPAEQTQAQGRRLMQQASELAEFAQLQTGDAELVQRATVPATRSAPKPLRNTLLGLVLGLLFAVGLVIILDRLDRRLRDPQTFEDMVDARMLAAIPESRSLRGAGRDLRDLPPAELEAFRMLRARLRYFNVDSEIRIVLITSGAPGEGKSTVALNLAAASATASDARVLLLEADLRRPSLARAVGEPLGLGLSELLTRPEVTVEDVITPIPVNRPADNQPELSFGYIQAGGVPPNPQALLESDRFKETLEELSDRYDLIVIDTPPTSVVSDAMPLMSLVDGVIVVSRLNLSTRDGVRLLQRQLEDLRAPLLGWVLNGLRSSHSEYGYYGGNYYAVRPVETETR